MARWLSWLERRPVTAEVAGSSPARVGLKLHICLNGVLAQLGEHLPYKQGVIGSSPIRPIFLKSQAIRLDSETLYGAHAKRSFVGKRRHDGA